MVGSWCQVVHVMVVTLSSGCHVTSCDMAPLVGVNEEAGRGVSVYRDVLLLKITQIALYTGELFSSISSGWGMIATGMPPPVQRGISWGQIQMALGAIGSLPLCNIQHGALPQWTIKLT